MRLGFSHPLMEEWLKKAGLSLERAVDLHSEKASDEALDVTIWVARDQRLLMADDVVQEAVLLAAGRA